MDAVSLLVELQPIACTAVPYWHANTSLLPFAKVFVEADGMIHDFGVTSPGLVEALHDS
jgi:hypothetical protein